MSEGPDDRSIVISTWELSLDQLAVKGLSQSRALLLVVACFAPAIPIPWFLLDHSILAQVCPDHRSEDVGPGLDALRTVGLIELRPSGNLHEAPAVVVHPLVAETILFRSRTDNLGQSAVRTAADLLGAAADALSPDAPDQWPSWTLLVPHIDALLAQRLPELDESGLVVLARAARLISDALIWSGAYISSQKLATAALIRTISRLPEQEEILRLRCVRAMANLNLRMLDESEQELRAIIMIQRRILGPDHDDTLASSHELAATLARQAQFHEAETLYRDILERRARLCHPDRYSFSSRHELARVLAEQGRLDEAEFQYRDLLDSRIRVDGVDYPKTLITRFRMAELVGNQGRIEEAEHLFQDVLNDSVRVLGPEHPDTLKIRYGLAVVLADEGRTTKADLQYQKVLSGQRKVLGVSHPATLLTENAIRALHEHGTI
jgi:tetratricopeptide (TPR) repeat protein